MHPSFLRAVVTPGGSSHAPNHSSSSLPAGHMHRPGSFILQSLLDQLNTAHLILTPDPVSSEMLVFGSEHHSPKSAIAALLRIIWYQTMDAMTSNTFEVRRMALQVLPHITEALHWTDLEFLRDVVCCFPRGLDHDHSLLRIYTVLVRFRWFI